MTNTLAHKSSGECSLANDALPGGPNVCSEKKCRAILAAGARPLMLGLRFGPSTGVVPDVPHEPTPKESGHQNKVS